MEDEARENVRHPFLVLCVVTFIAQVAALRPPVVTFRPDSLGASMAQTAQFEGLGVAVWAENVGQS